MWINWPNKYDCQQEWLQTIIYQLKSLQTEIWVSRAKFKQIIATPNIIFPTAIVIAGFLPEPNQSFVLVVFFSIIFYKKLLILMFI